MSFKSAFNARSLSTRWRWLTQGPVVPDEPIHYNTSCPAPYVIPDDWEYINHETMGVPVGCVRARERGELKGKITLITGFKTSADWYNTPAIQAYQEQGYRIDIIPLPDPGEEIGYLTDYKKMVRDILIDNPIPDDLPAQIPHFIIAHSLGGRAVTSNMFDEIFSDTLAEKYAGAILAAPHYSSPYRSKPMLNGFYSSYCATFHDCAYGEAPLDWAFETVEKVSNCVTKQKMRLTNAFNNLAACNSTWATVKSLLSPASKILAKTLHIDALAIKDTLLSQEEIESIQGSRSIFEERSRLTNSPITTQNTATTHGQILYSNLEGEKLKRRMETTPLPETARHFPLIMMGGSKDFVSCNNFIKEVADIFGAKFYEFDTYHNPVLESDEANKLIFTALQEMGESWQRRQLYINNVVHFPMHKREKPHITASPFEDPMVRS